MCVCVLIDEYFLFFGLLVCLCGSVRSRFLGVVWDEMLIWRAGGGGFGLYLRLGWVGFGLGVS